MSIAKNGGTRLTVRMCDLDIIERLHALFPCTGIQVVHPKPVTVGGSCATQYAWRISDPATVREILGLLLPWFGKRRAAKAREVLAHLDSRPGTGGYQRLKTHCAQNHEYTPENTYIRPGTTHRHCRTCRNDWSRQSVERKNAKRQAPQAQEAY